MAIESILNSVKKNLGLDEAYDVFDADVIMHINTVFTILNDLGVGTDEVFYIESDAETWSQFLGDSPNYNAVKTYVFLRVKLLFDPPNNSFLITSLNEQIKELAYRMNERREVKSWIEPFTP